MVNFPNWKLLGLSVVVALMRSRIVTAQDDCAATLPELPAEVQEAKDNLIQFCLDNVDRYGDKSLQSTIDEYAQILEDWFVFNRPDNELDLTRKSWRPIWSESDFIPAIPFLFSDRENGFQIVQDGYYYNLGKYDIAFSEDSTPLFSLSNYLRGEFDIVDPKSDFTCGQPRRNVVDLEFVRYSVAFGFPEKSQNLTELAIKLDKGRADDGIGWDIPVFLSDNPLFNGASEGFLWNMFVDDELRVCTGTGGDDEEDFGIWVQIRDDFPNV